MLRFHRRAWGVVVVVLVALLAGACGQQTASTDTVRAVPNATPTATPPAPTSTPTPTPPTPTPPPPTAEPVVEEATAEPTSEPTVEPTVEVVEEPTPAPPAATATAVPVPRTPDPIPPVRSFQEYIPDPASIAARYGGQWTLKDITYLEPGPRGGKPCGPTQPQNLNGIEVLYQNGLGERLIVLVQQGFGVETWFQSIVEGVQCEELGLRLSTTKVPNKNRSVVLEIDPSRQRESMAVAAALENDILINFVSGAVSPTSALANPQLLAEDVAAMFDRVNADQ